VVEYVDLRIWPRYIHSRSSCTKPLNHPCMEHGCYPRFSPPECHYPMGCMQGLACSCKGLTPVEIFLDAAFSRKTRAGRDHCTGSVDPSLRPPMEKRREAPVSIVPRNTRTWPLPAMVLP